MRPDRSPVFHCAAEVREGLGVPHTPRSTVRPPLPPGNAAPHRSPGQGSAGRRSRQARARAGRSRGAPSPRPPRSRPARRAPLRRPAVAVRAPARAPAPPPPAAAAVGARRASGARRAPGGSHCAGRRRRRRRSGRSRRARRGRAPRALRRTTGSANRSASWASSTVNDGSSPAASACPRSTRAQKPWIVEMNAPSVARAASSASSSRRRRRIQSASPPPPSSVNGAVRFHPHLDPILEHRAHESFDQDRRLAAAGASGLPPPPPPCVSIRVSSTADSGVAAPVARARHRARLELTAAQPDGERHRALTGILEQLGGGLPVARSRWRRPSRRPPRPGGTPPARADRHRRAAGRSRRQGRGPSSSRTTSMYSATWSWRSRAQRAPWYSGRAPPLL